MDRSANPCTPRGEPGHAKRDEGRLEPTLSLLSLRPTSRGPGRGPGGGRAVRDRRAPSSPTSPLTAPGPVRPSFPRRTRNPSGIHPLVSTVSLRQLRTPPLRSQVSSKRDSRHPQCNWGLYETGVGGFGLPLEGGSPDRYVSESLSTNLPPESPL